MTVVQAFLSVVRCVLAVADQREDARELPVGNRQVTTGAVCALRPVPERGEGECKHLVVFVGGPVGLLDELPCLIEAVGRKPVVCRGGVERGRIIHGEMILHFCREGTPFSFPPRQSSRANSQCTVQQCALGKQKRQAEIPVHQVERDSRTATNHGYCPKQDRREFVKEVHGLNTDNAPNGIGTRVTDRELRAIRYSLREGPAVIQNAGLSTTLPRSFLVGTERLTSLSTFNVGSQSGDDQGSNYPLYTG